MILREMLVDDLDQVMEIEEELFSVPWTKEGFLTFLMKENGMFLVVEEKGRILGYCGLLTVLDEGDVTNVAVRRDRQREGIGNFLMESMIRLAEERGITMIHLEVRAGNETAIRLYERQGFVRDGLRKGYYTDPTEDAVLMTRTAFLNRLTRERYLSVRDKYAKLCHRTGKEEKYVRCLFTWLRRNDAAATQMAHRTDDPL